MTTLKILSVALIAAATLATPVLAREGHVATARQVADASATASYTGFGESRVCVPAPRVGAFATAPWTGTNVPCEP
jgi:hypothetical protein